MGLTCLICGNSGFTNAFVHCVRCLDFVVHRYCLDTIPEIFDEYVHWLCEDSDLKVRHKKREAPCQTTHIKALENGTGLTAVDHVDTVELPHKCSSEENTHFKASENDKGLTGVDHVGSVEISNSCSSQDNEEEKTKDNRNAKEKKRSNTESTIEEEQTKPGNNSSKQHRKECASTDTMKRAKSASESVLPKEKEIKEAFEQRDERSLSEQPCESNAEPGNGNHLKEEKTKDNQSKHPNLVDKRNAKEKKRSNTEATMEEEQKKPCNNSSKQLRKECASTDTMKRAKLASDSVLPKEKGGKKVFEKRNERSLSEQTCESNAEPGNGNHLKEEKTKDNQSKHPNLVDKRNAKEKKRANTEVTMEEEQKKPCNNSSKQLSKECASTDTMKRAKLASDSVLPKEKGGKKVFEKRDERSLSEQPCESNTEPGTGNHIKEEGVTASSGGFYNQGYEMNCEARIVIATNNQQLFAKDPSILPSLNPNVRNEPRLKPVWRGSFEILNPNQHILEGLMAHLSCKACDKAYDVSRQFQTVLQLEMLPKYDVWPKSFQSSQPNDDHIALYFFPSTTSERVFDHLVNEMMEKELAMRARVQNAELLLFHSTELPMLYWRFQGKYYLWGVFKGNQRAPSQTRPSTRETECKTAKNENTSKGVVTKRGNERSPLSTLNNNDSPAVSS